MQSLQDRAESDSIREAFIKSGSFGDNDKDAIRNMLKQASTANMLDVFRAYRLGVDEHNKRCVCPFPFHKERTGSFNFFKETNSFFCFGCKIGGGPIQFVSSYEGIDKLEAAKRIVSKFDVDMDAVIDSANGFIDRQQLFLSFSDMIRAFISDNLDDNSAIDYSEKVSLIFDTLNARHRLGNDGLKSLIDKLRIKLEQFKCQQL